MRVTLDTNVLVAAFAAKGTCAELLEHCEREHEVVLSEYILTELRDKLEQRLRLESRDIRAVLKLVRQVAVLVRPVDLPGKVCRDASDIPVLGTALAGRSRVLITGDQDLLELKNFRGIHILRPVDFWRFEVGEPRE